MVQVERLHLAHVLLHRPLPRRHPLLRDRHHPPFSLYPSPSPFPTRSLLRGAAYEGSKKLVKDTTTGVLGRIPSLAEGTVEKVSYFPVRAPQGNG
jgi:hypothetical protein